MQCCMADFNLTPMFKYSTLICRQVKDIPTRAISNNNNNQHIQSWNPITSRNKIKMRFDIFFEYHIFNILNISFKNHKMDKN